ncbi:glycoside hydrolase family 64 protein [Microlunatus ginsengisoli]|uniref:GH64 domain-containing protein n=1 Tax=Microlunatus ginsengisoli TaxID=363863 RepID=A0ABP6ZR24_9ACTN
MLTRRTFLSSTALTLGAGAVAGPAVLGSPIAEAAPATLPLDLVNRRHGRKMFATVCGVDPATGRWFFLSAKGSKIFPKASGSASATVSSDVAIPLSSSGRIRRLRLPRMLSGRVFLSLDRPLRFAVTPGGGIAMPSAASPSDPGAAIDWGFFELTLDRNGVYANLSFVDFVGLPLSMRLATSGASQYVGGLRHGGVAKLAAGLRAQSDRDGSGWDRLVVRRGGRELRILSPNLAADLHGGASPVAGYLDRYVADVWRHYRSHTLVVDTQARWGRLKGRVSSDGRLVFGGAGSFARPSTYAILNCSVAPFHTSNDVMGNLSARLAAALNRTSLLANPHQPDTSPRHFYTTSRTNHYARLVHRNSIGGAGYAFPYDDVHTKGWNAEGRVVHGHPKLLRIEAG